MSTFALGVGYQSKPTQVTPAPTNINTTPQVCRLEYVPISIKYVRRYGNYGTRWRVYVIKTCRGSKTGGR